jgi:hypothetical protein
MVPASLGHLSVSIVPVSIGHPSVGTVLASLGRLSVRYLHVLAAALATGGGALVYAVARTATRTTAGGTGSADAAGADGVVDATGADGVVDAAGADRAVDATGADGSADATAGTAPTPESTLAAATAYEWLFWGALAALVATGVGNLGALAPALPRGRWGAVLAIKLALVLAVLAGSALRTLAVCRLRAGGAARPGALRRWYGATALALAGLVALAEVLAHG